MTNVNIKVMEISRATVNAYLAETRNRGIVTVSIDPVRLGAVEVAQSLKQRRASRPGSPSRARWRRSPRFSLTCAVGMRRFW
jgi:hypothetical protein